MTQPALGQSLPERHRHRVWPWALALTGALVAITWLATTPNPPRDLDTGWDKSNHLLAFAVLALLADRMVIAWRRGTAARLAAWGLVLAYGGLIELLQSQIPGRAAEWSDLFADALGVALGLAVGWLMNRAMGRWGVASRIRRP